MAERLEENSELAGYRRMAGEVYDILQRSRLPQRDFEYSEESKRLAREIVEKIQLKLEKTGRTLTRDPRTGRYSIVDLPAAQQSRDRVQASSSPTPVVGQQAQARRSFWSRLFKR